MRRPFPPPRGSSRTFHSQFITATFVRAMPHDDMARDATRPLLPPRARARA